MNKEVRREAESNVLTYCRGVAGGKHCVCKACGKSSVPGHQGSVLDCEEDDIKCIPVRYKMKEVATRKIKATQGMHSR